MPLDVSLLTSRHPLPLDLRDAVLNFDKWMLLATSMKSLGLVLLIILLKFPICRSCFLKQMKGTSCDVNNCQRVFSSLACVAVELSDKYSEKYIAEVDNIKAVGLAHGFAIVAVKLKVLKPCADGPVKLISQTYRVLQPSKSALNAIERFLSGELHNNLQAIDTCVSVSHWASVFAEYVKAEHGSNDAKSNLRMFESLNL